MTLPPGERRKGPPAPHHSQAPDGPLPEGQEPDIVIEPDAEHLARAVATALVARLAAAQAVHDTASVVLTGGGIGTAVLTQVAALAAEPARERVDWAAVDVWWGDERFVPEGDDERNELGARRALLDHVPVTPERVHAMPPSDGEFAEPEDAAAWYAGQLAAAATPEPERAAPPQAEGPRPTHPSHARGEPPGEAGARAMGGGGALLPRFDVLLLGMGPEGHVASIFPDSPAVDDERPVFAVHDCPKPPPTRISLGFGAIASAEEVWLLVSGEPKAAAVARALSGAAPADVPAAGVHGRRATRWLIDRAAASKLGGPA